MEDDKVTYKGRVFEFSELLDVIIEYLPSKLLNKKERDSQIMKLYELFEGRKSPHFIPVKEVCKAIGVHPNSFWSFWTKEYVQKQTEEIGLKLRTRKPRKYRKYGRWNYPKPVQGISNTKRPVCKPSLERVLYTKFHRADTPIYDEILKAGVIPMEPTYDNEV